MMFDDVLIESAGRDKKKGGWLTAVISTVIHLSMVGAVIAAGYYVKKNPEVIEKPISAFIVTSAPPPPPPPPPASSGGATQPKRPTVETPKTPQEFRQPTVIPQDVPQVDDAPSTDTAAVEGGVVGGVKGGVVGGVVGGVIGGQIGGTLGGQLGGQLGGTGDSPVRVGGNIKAPVIIEPRADPKYTEIARKARISGIVIIEAVIDRMGNVTEARILKGLPMGLDQEALNAIRQWKFKPGTLNGNPVAVYYNLTVNFRLNQ